MSETDPQACLQEEPLIGIEGGCEVGRVLRVVRTIDAVFVEEAIVGAVDQRFAFCPSAREAQVQSVDQFLAIAQLQKGLVEELEVVLSKIDRIERVQGRRNGIVGIELGYLTSAVDFQTGKIDRVELKGAAKGEPPFFIGEAVA